jgi:hypothetical protein
VVTAINVGGSLVRRWREGKGRGGAWACGCALNAPLVDGRGSGAGEGMAPRRGGAGRPWPGDGGGRRWETHLTGGSHLSASARERKVEWAGRRRSGPQVPARLSGKGGPEAERAAGKKKRKGGKRSGPTLGWAKRRRERRLRGEELEVGFQTFELLFLKTKHTIKQNKCKGMYAFNHLVNSKFNCCLY